MFMKIFQGDISFIWLFSKELKNIDYLHIMTRESIEEIENLIANFSF